MLDKVLNNPKAMDAAVSRNEPVPRNNA